MYNFFIFSFILNVFVFHFLFLIFTYFVFFILIDCLFCICLNLFCGHWILHIRERKINVPEGMIFMLELHAIRRAFFLHQM